MMNAITTFPQTLVKAVSSPSFYREIPKTKLTLALKYFLIFSFILASIKTTFLVFTIIPGTEKLIDKVRYNLVDFYPPELIITIAKGQLSTNAQEPYVVPLTALETLFPKSISDVNEPPYQNLVVIDTKANPEDFPKYKSAVLFTQSSLVIADQANTASYQVTPIPANTDLTVDRRLVRSLWSQFSPYLNYVVPGLIILIFIFFFLGLPSWNLSYLLLAAFLLKIFFKQTSQPLDFRSAYKIGLYALTVPLLAEMTLGLFGFSLPPLSFTLIFIFFVHFMRRSPATAPLPK